MKTDIAGIFYRCKLSDRKRSEFLIEARSAPRNPSRPALPKSLQNIADSTTVGVPFANFSIRNTPICVRRLESGIQIYPDIQDYNQEIKNLMKEIHERAQTYFKRMGIVHRSLSERSLELQFFY